MRLFILCFLLISGASFAPLQAAQTYDLIFKTGTLSEVSKDSILVYNRNILVNGKPKVSADETGSVKLTFEPDDMAKLEFTRDKKRRVVGSFPATVGNPIIMYFVETVIRDVAHNTGGSPFYIRNRVKESLIQFAEIENKVLPFGGNDVPVKQITLHPFLNDKNIGKMRGYGNLALTVTMSGEVPGWYYSLVANVKGTEGNAPIYTNSLVLTPGGQK
ncbi:MAG: hypothetical protein GY742_18715 [Hyphomicrobiales bacterium]|nr:hypothetical protein [Hyphomicrobiales bacterium]